MPIPPRSTPLAVGDVAPDFTLQDQNRKDWKLSDAVRKGDVVLSVIPFAFTGVCGTEMGCISKDAATWQGKGATVVGLCCDSPFANAAWAAKEGYAHTILSDLHREVAKGYGIHWPEMNVAQRATIHIGKSADGVGRVKFIQTRPPGQAMDWAGVLGML